MTKRIKLWDRYFGLFIDAAAIGIEVKRLARDLSRDYMGKRPLFVVVLNGAVHFASDLTRDFPDTCELSFVRYSSYQGAKSTGELKKLIGIQENVFGRHVVVVEDIVDSGLTLSRVFEELAGLDPLSIRSAALLYKPKASQYAIKPDYVGFEIDNDFVVGYGLDYNGLGRNLPDIYKAV